MRAQSVLFDGFDPLDVIAPYQVLHAAGMAADGAVTVELVTAEGAREVPGGTSPLTLRATGMLDPARAEVVILPGATGDLPAEEEISEEERRRAVPAILARALETDLPALAREALEREIGPRIAHAIETPFAHGRRGVVWPARGPAPTLAR
ncbi:hypothetical protein [Streptosporangium roseum]|uniref:Uncharacterized protein n=1 Tax=Streptosporangium roseum (strain ATCC 12428 / DSM 43021 / JCM 3005 / KCTC 9067 / NCIMB 10171 / NRRL 2505 / NI 9100) TaxID=479432 RepID=D2BAA3_STRRD|nr:hypothetical protein [Streptosporangium roseum]ACZ87928.1 hypothetical protein Sros_5150 [Streptosporangium roseum DSM 43021]